MPQRKKSVLNNVHSKRGMDDSRRELAILLARLIAVRWRQMQVKKRKKTILGRKGFTREK